MVKLGALMSSAIRGMNQVTVLEHLHSVAPLALLSANTQGSAVAASQMDVANVPVIVHITSIQRSPMYLDAHSDSTI